MDDLDILNLYPDLFIEASQQNSKIVVETLYPKIEQVLSTPIGDRKFKQIVGNYIDRNSSKLYTSGPVYLIPFGDVDKAEYFNLFHVDKKDIVKMVNGITAKISSSSDFKLLRGNPIFWVFWCCIRFYTINKKNNKIDEKGLNSALAIYALAVYPSIFSLYFKYGADEGVMQYTMDKLSNKYILKQEGSLFGGLFKSISNSYAFLKDAIAVGLDADVIRFIQRIRNDQKSMFKNICNAYMDNHRHGRRVRLGKDSYDETQLDVDADNNTSIVEIITSTIVNAIITNGMDIKIVKEAKDIAEISFFDLRFYLSKIITDKYTENIHDFISAILFEFLYTDRYAEENINSSRFLTWSAELFRKTNSNNPNIKTIKNLLDLWAKETGIHQKFKREASRVNYKKGIFWYFILSIQTLHK